jgi:DNA polymerase III subunit epsilon
MWKHFFSLDLRREWTALKMPNSPMKDYYRRPLPWPETDYRDVEYLCIDLELTGLDLAKDEIISVGFAPVIKQR